jgi:hypothetical protein
MGDGGRAKMQKQRELQAEMLFSKTGVWHRRSKNAFSREKSAIAMVLTPSNDPGFC